MILDQHRLKQNHKLTITIHKFWQIHHILYTIKFLHNYLDDTYIALLIKPNSLFMKTPFPLASLSKITKFTNDITLLNDTTLLNVAALSK